VWLRAHRRGRRHQRERRWFLLDPDLLAGSYNITFRTPVIKKHQVSFTRQNAQNATIDPTLAVGDVAEQVTVTEGDVQLVTYDSGTVSNHLDRNRIDQLPQDTRRYWKRCLAVVPTHCLELGIHQATAGLPFQTPINNTPGALNYGTNNVLAPLKNGNWVLTAYSPAAAGAHPFWLRLKRRCINAFNIQRRVNPNVTDGIQQLTTSYWTPRQIQVSAAVLLNCNRQLIWVTRRLLCYPQRCPLRNWMINRCGVCSSL
jgi:hypothetical protein